MLNTRDSMIEGVRKSAVILKQTLQELKKATRPGITTAELDKMAEEFILERGGKCAFKGYQGFPGTICASVNEVVVHGIPTKEVLKEGDILGIDCGVLLNGYYSDSALTVAVGNISSGTRKLVEITEKALYAGIQQARIGNRVGDISNAVQTLVESEGFGVVRAFVGHGIGKNLHEPPEIPNFGTKGTGDLLKEGMTIAIEPMVTVGTHEIEVLEDGWTAVTKDRKLAAHFEHTLAITNKGPEVLT